MAALVQQSFKVNVPSLKTAWNKYHGSTTFTLVISKADLVHTFKIRKIENT